MIHPNMATMLCFVTTDADIAPELCRRREDVADETFNMISVDGDTRQTICFAILASGAAANEPIKSLGKEYYHFQHRLVMIVCRRLARELAADGEGATSCSNARDWRARSAQTAKKVAKSVICSRPFKAAMFGGDQLGRVRLRHRLYGRGV